MVRAAASKGPFDLVAIDAVAVLLVQVKSTRPPSPAERAELAAFPCPANCRPVVHVWRPRRRLPEVVELVRDPMHGGKPKTREFAPR